MSHLSMMLGALMMLALAAFIAPGIFALNRGHILRNIALWLAIFLGLALFYQNFGPTSEHPLFQLPESMSGMNRDEAPKLSLPGTVEDGKKDQDSGEQGFTPPKE